MAVRFYNTLTQKVEEFRPLEGEHSENVHLRPHGLSLRTYR